MDGRRPARRRHHRLRQHLRRLLQARAALQAASRSAPAPTSTWPPPKRGPRSSASRRRAIDALLANPDVDVVINLTIPDAHFAVTARALEAGKHVYSEKPFVLSVEEGLELKALADAQEPPRRLRARHLPRRRPPARAQADRRRRARHRHRRHRLRHVARHGDLAPEPGLLLPARRRPDARRRPLLRRRPRST